jgi:hypothetical protein
MTAGYDGCLQLTELSLSLSLISWPTVSRPVCLGISHPSGAYDHIFIAVGQLRVCWCGTFSLTRGRVCRLQLLLVSPAQSFSGQSPMGLVTIFYPLRFETSLFDASYDSQGYGGGTRPCLHTGVDWNAEWTPFHNSAPTEDRTLSPSVRVFVCWNLRIRCHGNSYQSCSNEVTFNNIITYLLFKIIIIVEGNGIPSQRKIQICVMLQIFKNLLAFWFNERKYLRNLNDERVG